MSLGLTRATNPVSLADITDRVVSQVCTADIISRAFDELLDLMEIRFLTSGWITPDKTVGEGNLINPVHWKTKRWMVEWICMQTCLEIMGANNVDTAKDEKYAYKFQIYKEREQRYHDEITVEMLLGTMPTAQGRASVSGRIYRG